MSVDSSIDKTPVSIVGLHRQIAIIKSIHCDGEGIIAKIYGTMTKEVVKVVEAIVKIMRPEISAKEKNALGQVEAFFPAFTTNKDLRIYAQNKKFVYTELPGTIIDATIAKGNIYLLRRNNQSRISIAPFTEARNPQECIEKSKASYAMTSNILSLGKITNNALQLKLDHNRSADFPFDSNIRGNTFTTAHGIYFRKDPRHHDFGLFVVKDKHIAAIKLTTTIP
jgi:hypothetical protein